MTTAAEATEHFKALVRGDSEAFLDKATTDAVNAQSRFIQVGSGGPRMYLEMARHFSEQLEAVRRYAATAADTHLKPFVQLVSADTLAELRQAPLLAFDDVANAFRSRFAKFERPPSTTIAGASAELEKQIARHRDLLSAELSLILSRPGGATAHRLVAVLSTDVVGYSTRMAVNEKEARRVADELKAASTDAIAKHGGRLFKDTGDGTLSEFPSTAAALHAAIQMQQSAAARNSGKPEDDHAHLRIGLAVGDVVVEEEDLKGTVVNLAARLQTCAEPGGIATVDYVYHDLANKPTFSDLPVTNRGDQLLKGMAVSLRVVEITPG